MLNLNCVAAVKSCVMFLCSLAPTCWEPLDVAAAAAELPAGIMSTLAVLCNFSDEFSDISSAP